MKRFIYSLLVLSIVSLPSYSFAQTTAPAVTNTTAAPAATQDTNTGFVPLTSLPGLASTSSAGATGSLPVFLSMLYKLCIGAAAVFAVIQIMRAGLRGITNNESVLAKSEARSMIQNAVIGLILALSPYVVFSVIDQNKDGTSPFLNFNFTNDLVSLQSTTTQQSTVCTAQNLAACTSTTPATTAQANQNADQRIESHVSTNSTYLNTLATNLATARKSQPTGKLFLDIQSWGEEGLAACEQTKDTNGVACVAGQTDMIGYGEAVPQKQYTCACGG